MTILQCPVKMMNSLMEDRRGKKAKPLYQSVNGYSEVNHISFYQINDTGHSVRFSMEKEITIPYD